MIEGVRPYEDYKEADLPWLDRIPAYWSIVRASSLLRKVDVRSWSGSEKLLTVSSQRGVVPRASANVTMFKAKSYEGYKLCWPGDLVINSLWAWAGGLGVSNHHGIISSAYGVYRSRHSSRLSPRFLHELVRSAPFNWELQVRSKGIWISRLQLTDYSFLGAPLLLPPPNEQAAIARFLDHANHRINRFIRAKKKLIALLNEQKQAIIHRAVTRGLDPNVPMKDSGVPWLGEVPEHWEVRKLKACITRIEQGWSPQCDAQSGGLDEWSVLKVGCVNGDTFAPEQNKRLPPQLSPKPELEIRHNDILVSRANTRQLLGLAALAEYPRPRLILCDKLFRFRAQDGYEPRFLVLALRSKPVREQIERSTNGASSSMQNVGQSVLKNLTFGVPSKTEQQQICSAISELTEPVMRTIFAAEREITLIQEYRTRLIADVVTGQLDVRAAAASLPELDPDEVSDSVYDDEPIEDEFVDGDEAA